VIHGCAWVEEIDGGGVSEVANAVVHSVINIPAGSLKLVSASETHQGSFIHGHAAQACTLWNVRKRPCAIASALNLRFPKLNWVFAIECGSYGRLSPGLRDDLLVIQNTVHSAIADEVRFDDAILVQENGVYISFCSQRIPNHHTETNNRLLVVFGCVDGRAGDKGFAPLLLKILELPVGFIDHFIFLVSQRCVRRFAPERCWNPSVQEDITHWLYQKLEVC